MNATMEDVGGVCFCDQIVFLKFFYFYLLQINFFEVLRLFWYTNIKNKFLKIKNYFNIFLNKKYLKKL
jgi:hypothetical protein